MFLQEEAVAMGKGHLTAAIVVLSLFFLANLSHADSRAFYDGFESGNTNLWDQAPSSHARCQMVTSSVDGVAGPYAGRYMARCNTDGSVNPNAFDTLEISDLNYTNEIFYRIRVRVDQDFTKTSGSCGKILRVYIRDVSYNDIYSCIGSQGTGLRNEGVAGDNQFATYWGGSPGDNTKNPGGWHIVEYYFNAATGKIRVWNDEVMVRDTTMTPGFGGQKWYPFFIQSNFDDPHDATNHTYFDEVEVFTDTGTGASGSMADGSVSASASVAPSPPSGVIVN